jgi:hypothetical protein
MMTPAAIRALAEGDMLNFLVASTPGGIEAQEAAGQTALVQSQMLPKVIRGITREKLEEGGFKFGKDVDDIFVECELPAGWTKRATDHSMHSDLVDDKGRRRAGIFYKAAFYDRSAYMSMTPRFRIDAFEDGSDKEHQRVVVKDGETVIHEVGQYKNQDYDRQDELRDAGKVWLNQNFPQWENPLAHWD